MRTKVCGIRNLQDAMTAINAGADAVGFLVGITHLAEDKISKEDARDIIEKLTDKDEIVELAKYLHVDTVQIHDCIPPEDVKYVREKLYYCKILKAIHVLDRDEALNMVKLFEGCCDALLLDSRTKERLGGTGLTHDWNVSREIVEKSSVPVILAGGITDKNSYDAVKKVRPYGIDANSGVEIDGYKSYEKVKAYIENARLAEEEQI